MPYPPDERREGARRARRQCRHQRICGQAARLQDRRRRRSARPSERAGLARTLGAGQHHTSSAWSAIRASARSARRSTRSCSARSTHGPGLDDRPLQRRSGRRSAPRVEREWKQITNEVPFNAKFSEDVIGEALRGGRRAGEDLRRLRPARGDHRLPRPVRPRRLHRRAADQGNRHPQGARRPHPRHRPVAGVAVQPAGDHRQHHRLAGRLVADARLAQWVRPADHAGADAVHHGRR